MPDTCPPQSPACQVSLLQVRYVSTVGSLLKVDAERLSKAASQAKKGPRGFSLHVVEQNKAGHKKSLNGVEVGPRQTNKRSAVVSGRLGARRRAGVVPNEKVADAEKMKGYLDVSLRVPCPDVVRRVVVLGANGEDGEQNGQPGRRHGPGRLCGCVCILGSLLEVDHQLGFEVGDVDDKAPKGLGNLLVGAEKPGMTVSVWPKGQDSNGCAANGPRQVG